MSRVKLSDYVARFLAGRGVRHVFVISGGASLHLIHSVADTRGIEFVCPQHEQGAAMAAEAYSRVTGNLGAAMVTSGPGATNMLTGVCGAYFDSVPVIYVTGQVSTFRQKGASGVRQLGFQETDTVGIFRPVTKYAVRVNDPARIRYELEKSAHLALTGRPGPVLVDIPDDVQRMFVIPESLEPFRTPVPIRRPGLTLKKAVRECAEQIRRSSRPVLILGNGVKLAKALPEARRLVDRLKIPVAPTWAMMDFLPSDHPLLIGPFGTHGTRYGNFAVQNSDFVLSIGSRLDTRQAGSPATAFAREARKVVVDVDIHELRKFRKLDLRAEPAIHADAGDFMTALLRRCDTRDFKGYAGWMSLIRQWREKYPAVRSEYFKEKKVNPYVFVRHLSDAMSEGTTLVTDTGCAVAWIMQAFRVKKGQRLFHDFNNTAMGWGLPAAIGASFALGKGEVVCVTGDGSLQMSIQELATVIRHRLPVKIFLLNNRGHSMIQQTQDQWLGSRYLASSEAGGLAVPDFVRIAAAYGFPTTTLRFNRKLEAGVRRALKARGPFFCNVELAAGHRVAPIVKYGRSLEDAEPLLERDEFFENMLVPPHKSVYSAN